MGDVQCGMPGAQEQKWPQRATMIEQLTRKGQSGTSPPRPSSCEQLKLGKSQHTEVRESETAQHKLCSLQDRLCYLSTPVPDSKTSTQATTSAMLLWKNSMMALPRRLAMCRSDAQAGRCEGI